MEYLRLLSEVNFTFNSNDKEPFGIQKKVKENVNRQRYGGELFEVSKQLVSDWAARCRNNNYEMTAVTADYSRSSQNSRKFFDAEQKRIRNRVLQQDLKCDEVVTVYSDKKQRLVTVSKSSVRRALKRKLNDEPSCVAAVPKGMRVGGLSAHHDRCRLHEAEFWNGKTQEYLNGLWFADESKMTFREHQNKNVDVKWVFRGAADGANWFEKPRWPGQINLFLLQSRHGIEYSYIYERNMRMIDYKTLLPIIGAIIRDSDHDFTCYVHDNAWRGAQPTTDLNRSIGEGCWTKYMGKPCTKPHPTRRTPVRRLPVRIPKLTCECEFPEGPVHAAFNPKMNLVEQTFAKIDRQMTLNKREDEKRGRKWIVKGAGKKRFWKRELEKAIVQVDADKEFFEKQYESYKTKRCQMFIQSRGKRLKTSKY